MIQALPVKCTDDSGLCQWDGTVGTLFSHVLACDYAPFPCPYKCVDASGSIELFSSRVALRDHQENDCPYRDYKCGLCGKESTYAIMVRSHERECGMVVLPCPNTECTSTVERRGLKRHLEDCIHTEVPCKYQHIGCGVVMKRGDMPAHEAGSELHLEAALDAIKEAEKNKNAVTFKCSGFEEKSEDLPLCTLGSCSFYSSPNGYRIHVKVITQPPSSSEGGTLYAVITTQRGNNDEELQWPFVGTVALTLLNQRQNDNHFQQTLDFTPHHEQHRPQLLMPFISHSRLAFDPAKNTQYLKDDTLYFRVWAEVADHKPWLECTANDS